MENLPVEIIEHILSCNLTVYDAVQLSSVNKYFRDLINNCNSLWKRFFLAKWGSSVALMQYDSTNWLGEIKFTFRMLEKAHSILADMSPKFFKRYELSDIDLREWQEMLEEHPLAYYYLVGDLMEIVNCTNKINSPDVVPINTPGNWTYKYYATKVLRFIRHTKVSEDWFKYMSLPPDEQILEIGAALVAQWCQSTIEITPQSISQRLDQLAAMVKSTLRLLNENHPIFSTSQETQDKWRQHILKEHVWKTSECMQVLNAINETLYKQLGYYGNTNAYYIPENSFINEVLDRKYGLPLTMAIIYEAIARRLGVKCDPVSIPAHFMLRWSNHSDPTHPQFNSFYIDVFNNGNIIKRACSHANPNKQPTFYPAATAKQTMERMAENLQHSSRDHRRNEKTLLRDSLELLHLINPTSLTHMLNLARFYVPYNMDVGNLMQSLIEQLNSQELEEPAASQVINMVSMLVNHEAHHKEVRANIYPQIEPAPRKRQLLYAVGMVMQHLGLNYKCVIYDWDLECLATADWQAQMLVQQLRFKDKQPFYNVLVDDGSHRYVAQENLELTSEELQFNEDIGRHFSHTYGTYFVPNAEKEREYPSDKQVRMTFHEKIAK